MELWDAYKADGTLAGFDLVRGESIPKNYYHLVCEAIIQHTGGEYLLMQRSFHKEIYPGKWEIGAGGSALKGENRIQAIYVGFMLTTSHDKNSIQLQEGETIDYKWISKEELIEFYNGSECSPPLKERLKEFINSIR